jgi:hypothetical protein
MSKGPGKIQRRALALMGAQPDRWATAWQLAAEIYATEAADDHWRYVTAAQVNSVSRALHSLSKAGKVHRCGWRGQAPDDRYGRRQWRLGPDQRDRPLVRPDADGAGIGPASDEAA